MKGLTFLVFFVFSIHISAQQWDWVKAFGSTASFNHLNAEHITAWGDSGMVIIGNYNGSDLEMSGIDLPPSTNLRAFVSALDSKGDALWIQTFGDDYSTEVTGIAADATGNVYAIGNFQGIRWIAGSDTLYNQGASDGYVVKLNTSGDITWALSISTALNDKVMGISADENGNIYLTGYTENYNVTPVVSYGFIIKISSDGQVLWYKAGTSAFGQLDCESIVTDAEGNTWIAGSSLGNVIFEQQHVVPAPDSVYGAFIVQYNAEGTFVRGIFDKTIQGGYLRLARNNDRLTMTGAHYIDDSTGSYYTLRTMQLDTLLQRQWVHSATILPDVEQTIFPYGIVNDSSGNTFITGLFNGSWQLGDSITLRNIPVSTGGGYTNAFLLKLDENGVAKYAHSFGDTIMDQGRTITRLHNGKMAMVGMFMSDTLIFGDLVAVNPSDLQVFSTHGFTYYFRNTYAYLTVFSDAKINTFVRNYKATSPILAYPNPTNQTLYLQSETFTGQPVLVQIFSADGRLVRQQNISGAMQTIQIQTGDLPPGMYIATTIVNQQISSARFVKQ